MAAIIDGVVLCHENEFYNVFREAHSGKIFEKVDIGGFLYSWYDEEQAEAAKHDAVSRLKEYQEYESDVDIFELEAFIRKLGVRRYLDMEQEILKKSIVMEAAYL